MKKRTNQYYLQKLFAAFLALCMAILVFVTTASAEEYDTDHEKHTTVDIETGLCECGYQLEARIEDRAYDTFEAAFSAAKEGDTVIAYTGKSEGLLTIPEGIIFDGGEKEFSVMTENRGEIVGGIYMGMLTNYGKITDGLFDSPHYVVLVYNYGEITGGVFNRQVDHYSGKVTGGSFNRSFYAYVDIDGGHYTESAEVYLVADEMTGAYNVVINGGVFDCEVDAFSQIFGGEFNGEVNNCSEIYGGVFNGEVTNNRGQIFDGEFNAKVTNGVMDENGVLRAPGRIYGGSFNSEILNNKSLISNAGNDYSFTLGEGFALTNNEGTIVCEKHFKLSDATCKSQAVCRICASYGELTDHAWTNADCDTPKTCEVCGETEGESLGHNWIDATTEAPKTCEVCGATDGEKLSSDTSTDESPEVNSDPTNGDNGADSNKEERADENWFVRIINVILEFFRGLFGSIKAFFVGDNVN